jgi:5-methyltetrahydrofolate--homocysteine methyltransferase
MHAAFLYHAIAAGLDMGIVNAGMLGVYEEIEPNLLAHIEDVLLNRHPDATERLVALANEIKAASVSSGQSAVRDPQSAIPDAWRSLPVEQRLAHALVKGIDTFVEADTRRPAPTPSSTRARSTSSRGRSWTACAPSANSSAPGRCSSRRS